MTSILTDVPQSGVGYFHIEEGTDRVAEMEVEVLGKEMSVFHTEVAPVLEGRGIAKQLLETMVAYAREHDLKVKPLCSFVHAQFKRHPEQYADIWQKEAV